MPKIELSVNNKIIRLVNEADYIVCENSDYELVFTFDSEWENEPIKTVRFVYGGKKPIDKVIDSNICKVPKLPNVDKLEVGVYSGEDINNAKLKSTVSAYINCKYSCVGEEGTQEEPSEDVYTQIIALLNKYISQGGGAGGITEDDVVSLINENIAGLQPKTDEELQTISKDIVGAINELLGKIPSIDGIATEIYVDNKVKGLQAKSAIETDYNSTEKTLKATENTEYYFGTLTNLELSFDNGLNVGEMFYVTFTSGETATTLTVDSTNAVFKDFVPETNSIVEVCGKWNGSKWLVLFIQTVVEV